MASSDEALLAGLASGDGDASAEFVRRFQRRVYGLARTIVGDPGTAEDVAQEAFVRAWRYAASYDARRGTVLTWLLTIARNVAVDQLRLRQPEPLDPEVLASKLQLQDAHVSSDEHAAVADREQLRTALAVLPGEQRRALLLAAYFGRTAAEVAELEAIPLGTAKTRIRTAMHRVCATGWRSPMSDERCHETRALLAEVALGIADGADRARALEHVAECADCRRELEQQSRVADELLTLAPEHEPPIGFELGVLRAIEPPAPRRRSLLRPLVAVAAVAAAVAITAGLMELGFRDDRRLAEEYRAALAEANGTYFGARRLADAAGRPGGVLFVYRGAPSWILVTVAPAHREAVAAAEIVDRGGRRIALPAFRLNEGAWGGAIPVDLQAVAALHLVGEDGRSVLVAEL